MSPSQIKEIARKQFGSCIDNNGYHHCSKQEWENIAIIGICHKLKLSVNETCINLGLMIDEYWDKVEQFQMLIEKSWRFRIKVGLIENGVKFKLKERCSQN